MIRVHVHMVTPPEKHDEIERSLHARVGSIRALRGCLDCRLYREVDNENALTLGELWSDHTAWERHALSDSFREILVLVDLSVEPPDILFEKIQTTWGLQYLAALQSARESPAPAEPGEDQ